MGFFRRADPPYILMSSVGISASIHETVKRPTAKPHEDSKPRDSGPDFSNREMPVKCHSFTIIKTPNLRLQDFTIYCGNMSVHLVNTGPDLMQQPIPRGNNYDISSGPFYKHGLTLIPAWISNHMPRKVWDEITYPFLNFNGCTVGV